MYSCLHLHLPISFPLSISSIWAHSFTQERTLHFTKSASWVIRTANWGCEAYPTCQRSGRGITISQRSNQTHCFGYNKRMEMERKAGVGKRTVEGWRRSRMDQEWESEEIEDEDVKCQKIYKASVHTVGKEQERVCRSEKKVKYWKKKMREKWMKGNGIKWRRKRWEGDKEWRDNSEVKIDVHTWSILPEALTGEHAHAPVESCRTCQLFLYL